MRFHECRFLLSGFVDQKTFWYGVWSVQNTCTKCCRSILHYSLVCHIQNGSDWTLIVLSWNHDRIEFQKDVRVPCISKTSKVSRRHHFNRIVPLLIRPSWWISINTRCLQTVGCGKTIKFCGLLAYNNSALWLLFYLHIWKICNIMNSLTHV